MAPVIVTPKKTPVVLVCDRLADAGLEILREAGLEVRDQVGLDPVQLHEAVADVDAIVVRSATQITDSVLQAASQLRVVGRAGIGIDNIDVAAATRHGVLVMNTPLANATTTAELALAHLFSLARHIPAADQSMRRGEWNKSQFVGTEISGKVLTVVGLGKIGRIVAEKAMGVGMKVQAFDPYLTGESPLPGVALVDWENGLRTADFVSIHVPKSNDTIGLFDRHAFALMKKTASLIHCARGGIVVEQDLVSALGAGEIQSAALDVFEAEPLSDSSVLRSLPNLVLTPHLGASSDEAQRRVSSELAEQIVDFLLRDEARFAVNAPTVSGDKLTQLRPYLNLANRLGMFLAQTLDGPLKKVEITYAGELDQLPVDGVRVALLAGLLQPTLEGPVNAVNAELIAEERGLSIFERHKSSAELTTLKVVGSTADGQSEEVVGALFRQQPRIIRFNDFGMELEPVGALLMTRHRDQPGVLGAAATWFGERGINISGLIMGKAKQEGGNALALFRIDRPLMAEELRELTEISTIESVRGILF